ncbi:hypothetical protein JK361_08845 [Streptomyces sp. 5-8]|uniref:Uncharacterized protein n=2 Tax=Streptomyces TaxID=1883 RepID=A0ABS1NX55_9ACTN|nr:hypothetical protein [Streptomyces musisoli]MBY8846969.1 hypothetical protein [Streptomyces sp. SP2-10]
MPDNGLGAPAPGSTGRREAGTTGSPAPDTWPTAPGSPTATGESAAPGSPASGGTAAPSSPGAPGGTAAPGGMPLSGGTTAPAGTGASGTPTTPDASPTGGAAAPAPSGTGAPLLPHDETEQWERRMRELVGGFVDEPREAVEQADRTLEEIAARFSEAVTRRRRTLRMSWEGTEGRGSGAETDTERLRLALRDYRELAGRLLHG